MSQTDRGERAFDRVCGADVAPVLGRKIKERQQDIPIFNQALHRTFILGIESLLEQILNLHKPFLPIIKNPGLKPWPKLIRNLRASCETEWLDSGMPAHVVANWIGHSVKVQNDSYAQVDDHHFDQFNRMQSEKVAHQVAQKACETVTTPAKPCATGENKTAWAIKKHGQKTMLNAPERSRTNAVSPAVQQGSGNGGNPGGNFTTDFLTTLNDRLTAGGFTNQQIERIVSALQD
jgi:hypothetical protein